MNIFMVTLLCTLCCVMGLGLGRDIMRDEAIAKGYASYVCNPTNGHSSFEWKK